MRRLNWLPFAVVFAGTVFHSGSLIAQQADEAKVKEEKVRKTVLTRFDENRNDKLDSGEAKQARGRLRNLFEDKSSREINIMTWRDDVHDLLRHFDQDSDNRLTPEERDAGVRMLERIIPKVETEKSDEGWAAAKISGSSKSKSGVLDFTDFQRNQRVRGSGRGGVYHIGTVSGSGSGMGYTVGQYGMPFTGFGHTFAGVGSTGNISTGSMNGSSIGTSSMSANSSTNSSKSASDQPSGQAGGVGGSASPNSTNNGLPQSLAFSPMGLGPLTDSMPRGATPSGGASSGLYPGMGAGAVPGGVQRPGSAMPDPLAGSSIGPTRPTGSGLTGPVQTPPVPRPNF